MRVVLLLIVLSISTIGYGQKDSRHSTIDFVQILNGNESEALYYYQNNWKILREMAIKKGYIHSYQLLQSPSGEDKSFQLMLITTYTDKHQYDIREEHFQELIDEKGQLSLMNDKNPTDFRKTLFRKDMVRHWN